jgi:hypothetical protein
MEGYSIDGPSIIYQCYVCEAIEVSKRYEGQRDKITADTKKLVTKRDRVHELLGDITVDYWVLMVPLHDSKELVRHARAKEQEMREESLPFLAKEVRILIWTEDDFTKERIALDMAGVASILSPEPLTEEEVAASVAAIESEQLVVIDNKLLRAGAGAGGKVGEVRERILRQIVEADNIREHLRVEYPSTSERVLAELTMEERAVIQERDFNQLHEGSVVQVRQRLLERLIQSLPTLTPQDSDRLAYGAVGRWLLECPIDFPAADA